ncbi:MAG: hypothetical protein ABII82_17140 [Verrucomicrobiota bacterium]
MTLLLALIIGTLSIWKSATRYKITSGVCGLVFCVIASVQFMALMWMFSSGGSLTVTWGPLEIKGRAAPFALWIPLIIHALASLGLIWSTACEIDRTHKPANSEAS